MGFLQRKGVKEVYGDLFLMTDDPDEVVAFVEEHPPRAAASHTPLYELVEE